MNKHEFFMKRCLQLAKNGLGTTYPNPLVGSVIVDQNDQIIGEGWHYQSGEPHAEVNAVRDAEKRGNTDFSNATIYVNLEPCSHTGKTPPCAWMIIRKGFGNVVIGTLDPHEKVAGNGVRMLEEAGISCSVGVLEEECNQLNRRFFKYHRDQLPYVILKWAASVDGFIAPATKDEKKPVWITNELSRQRAHQLRAEEQAILIGGKTLLDDQPFLTTRSFYGRNSKRYVVSSKEIDLKLPLFRGSEPATQLSFKSEQIDLILEKLYQDGVHSVIIEGGAKTIQHVIDADAWDEAYIFESTTRVLGSGLKAPILSKEYQIFSEEQLLHDRLTIYQKK